MKKTNKTKLQILLEKESEKFIMESSKKIPQMLEKATLSLLGLEKNYQNNYDIDHCNGRNSVLIDAFRKLAQQEAEKLAKTYKPSETDIVGFKAAFEKEYKSQMAYIIRDLAKKRATEDAQKEIDNLQLDIKQIIEGVIDKP